MDEPLVMNTAVDQCSCFTLRRASRRVSALYDEALSPVGLRITQFSMLVLLWENGGLAINALADRMGLDRTTAGKNLKPLEREGYVSLHENAQDRRSREVRLTAEGREILKRAAPLWKKAQAAFDNLYGSERAQTLRSLLLTMPEPKITWDDDR
jgi:DNA-binding MarR family transcriptional regulator